MFLKNNYLFLCILATAIVSCSQPDVLVESEEGQIHRFEAPHMGTLFRIQVWQSGTDSKFDPAHLSLTADQAFQRIAELNQIFSDYLLSSEVNELRKTPANQPFKASKDLLAILKQSEQLHHASEGHFDITIGPMVQLWRRSLKNQRLPSADQIATARSRTGFEKLSINYQAGTVTKSVDHMVLDFGGIVKGHAADEALQILKAAGYPQALVAASGDIAIGQPPLGSKGWRVGLETLEMAQPSEVAFHLSNAAVSTSGDTKRFLIIEGQRYSHIVDKQTGLGLTNRIAVSVIAPSAVQSDSYATAISLMGAEKGIAWVNSTPGIECRIVTVNADQQSKVYYSNHFPK